MYWMFVAPLLCFLAIFFFLPLAQVLVYSVTDPSWGLQNFERLFSSGAIQRILLLTLKITVMTTLICVVVGYVIAYAMVHATGRRYMLMMFFVLVPFWLSIVIRAFAWIVLLRNNGIVNSFLVDVGLIDAPLRLARSEFGVLVGIVHVMLPFAVLTLLSSLKGVDTRLVLAARSLGATWWQSFRQIYLPITIPGIFGAGIIVSIVTLGFFITPVILGGGRSVMVAEYVSVQALVVGRMGEAAMLSVVMMAAVALLLCSLTRVVNLRDLFGTRQ
jgi:putative spermidine/putrescine transport system permease protein